jgi:hypothetical protein
MAARGPDNGRVGAVRDMLIAMDTGDVPFTIVSYGGLLGLGRKYTAVPANAIEFHPRDYTARIAVDEQILRANAFHPGDFPDLADPIYAQRIYSAYNVNPEDPDWVVLGYVPPEIPGRPQPQTPLSARPQTTFQTRPQTRITTQQQPTQQRTQGQTPIPGLQVPQTPAPSPLQNEYLAIFAADNLRTIEGVVTGVSTFQQVGTNAEWVQLQVRADDGSLVTIHLGPRAYVSRQDFYVASNDRITLTGAQATAWRQPIILPITATVGNETITLRDPSGRPLWLEPANGGNAQQNNQQTSQQSDVQNNQQNTPPAQQ